jgi:hypothetical protein
VVGDDKYDIIRREQFDQGFHLSVERCSAPAPRLKVKETSASNCPSARGIEIS